VTAAARVRDWDGWAAARAGLAEPGGAESGAVIGLLLDAWERAARGDHAEALALLDVPAARGTARSYLAEHRAHLLGHAGRWPEAADAYGRLIAGEGAGVPRLRLAAAAAALRAAEADPAWRTRAIAWLGDGPPRDPQLMAARALLAAQPERGAARIDGLVTRAQEGLALLFVRVAADLGRERGAGESALHFARLATFAAPPLADGWLLSADLLLRQGRPELALAALDRLPRGDPWPAVAEPRRAAALAEAGRLDAARALLTARAGKADATAEDWARLADLERRAERHAAAAAHYERALALAGDREPAWVAQLHFLAGAAHERAGAWPAAETQLRAALALQPDNATTLNYLGYSLLDRRLKLDEAKALIARAYAAQPENGAIIDSMGWAEHVAGNHDAAVRLLEQARAAEPADPTVADHLGDALWRAGRRIEARHAWASARALDPDPKLLARLEEKLDVGLRPESRMAATSPGD
jgi:tetratricopeptide (TPR) repeat protein